MNKALFYLRLFYILTIFTLIKKPLLKPHKQSYYLCTLKRFILGIVLKVVFPYITNRIRQTIFLFNYYE